jgi:hypothetical protein
VINGGGGRKRVVGCRREARKEVYSARGSTLLASLVKKK